MPEKLTLFRYKKFMLDEMTRQNASKFAIFYVVLYKYPKLLFPFFISHYFIFFLVYETMLTQLINDQIRSPEGATITHKISGGRLDSRPQILLLDYLSTYFRALLHFTGLCGTALPHCAEKMCKLMPSNFYYNLFVKKLHLWPTD